MLNTSFTSRSSSTVKIALCILLAVFFLCANSVFAEEGERLSTEASNEEEKQEKNKRLLLLPFPFFNDTIGTGVGVAAIAEGYIQPQLLSVNFLR